MIFTNAFQFCISGLWINCKWSAVINQQSAKSWAEFSWLLLHGTISSARLEWLISSSLMSHSKHPGPVSIIIKQGLRHPIVSQKKMAVSLIYLIALRPKKGHRAPEHTGVIPGIHISQMNASHWRPRMMKQTCRIAHHGNKTVVKPPPAFNSISTNSSISTSVLLAPYRRKGCWNLWGTIRMNLSWAARSLWTGHGDTNTMRVGGEGPWSISYRDSTSLYSVVVCCQCWSIALHICHSSALEALFTQQQNTDVSLVFEDLIRFTHKLVIYERNKHILWPKSHP